MRAPVVHALLVLLLLAAGCGDEGTEVNAGTAPTTSTAPELHLRVETGGGFVPVEVALATFPSIVVAEATAWVPGPQITIYPAPAVPAVQSAPLGDDDLRAIASRLQEAAPLFDRADFGEPPVSDLPTTSVEATIDGVERRLEVYGLYEDFAEEGLSAQQRDARRRVRELVTELRALLESPQREWTAGLTPRVRVSAVPADPASGGDDEGLDPGAPVAWPAGVPEPQFGPDTPFGCTVLAGAERDTLLEAARGTNVVTVWQLSGGLHRIVLRPLFPGEPGCA